jgi:hypothetical protein
MGVVQVSFIALLFNISTGLSYLLFDAIGAQETNLFQLNLLLICSNPIYDNWTTVTPIVSMIPIYKELIGAGLRVWVFR